MIKVFDVDDFSANASLEKHDFIGELEFMLHEIVTARNQILKKPLVNNKRAGSNNGTMIITADEYQQNEKSNETLEFELNCNLNQ